MWASHAEKCPNFPGVPKKINWSFENPADFKGTEDEILYLTRVVSDQVKAEVKNFIKELENEV
jgi:arsenate reductase